MILFLKNVHTGFIVTQKKKNKPIIFKKVLSSYKLKKKKKTNDLYN